MKKTFAFHALSTLQFVQDLIMKKCLPIYAEFYIGGVYLRIHALELHIV